MSHKAESRRRRKVEDHGIQSDINRSTVITSFDLNFALDIFARHNIYYFVTICLLLGDRNLVRFGQWTVSGRAAYHRLYEAGQADWRTNILIIILC
jgi:hypothetical protein